MDSRSLTQNPDRSQDAVKHLSRAMTLASDKYREMAKTDSGFEPIRDNAAFQTLMTSDQATSLLSN